LINNDSDEFFTNITFKDFSCIYDYFLYVDECLIVNLFSCGIEVKSTTIYDRLRNDLSCNVRLTT
jgi:hypothetical protein